MRLSELAERLDLKRHGDDVDITAIAPLETAGPGDLSFVVDRGFIKKIGQVSAVIVPPGLLDQVSLPLLVSPTPAVDFSRAAMLFGHREAVLQGIHPQAVIDPSARLGAGVTVGPLAVIGAHCTIGAGTVIHAGVVIHERCQIGNDCIIHANAVIGADGFGYEFDGKRHMKIPHLGSVRLGHGVEIGAGTTIDRARFGETVVGDGSKIDNLVQIGHNVQIGRHVIIVSQTGIAGSSVIEDGAVVGGQVGIAPHLTIGKGARIASCTGLANDVPPGATWSGWWGQDHRKNLTEINHVRKLPEFMKRVNAVLKRLESKE